MSDAIAIQYVSTGSLEAEAAAIGAVLRNWPHVFAVLNLFGQYTRQERAHDR